MWSETDKTISSDQEDTHVPDPKGLGHAFYHAMKKHGDGIVQIDASPQIQERFDIFLKRCIRTAIEMQNKGIKPGDVVGICSDNNLDTMVPFVAAQMIGAILVTFNHKLQLNEVTEMVKLVPPKMVFVSRNIMFLMVESMETLALEMEIVVFREGENYLKFEDFTAEKPNEDSFMPYEVDDIYQTAFVAFTDYYAPVCIHHYGYSYHLHNLVNAGLDLEVILSAHSLYCLFNLILAGVTVLYGKIRVITNNIIAPEMWFLVTDYQITFLALNPIEMEEFTEIKMEPEDEFWLVKNIFVIGEPNDVARINRLRRFLSDDRLIQVLYMQPEAAGPVLLFRLQELEDPASMMKDPRSCGRPLPGFKYKIVNSQKQKMDLGESGELRYQSKCQMRSYYGEDSSQAFDEEGFVRSGNFGYFGKDFRFYKSY